MKKRQLQFGITKERKMLWESLKPLKMPGTDLCANVSAFKTEEICREIDTLSRKSGFRGLASLENGFLNVRLDNGFLLEKTSQKASETAFCGEYCGETSFFEEYAVNRIGALSQVSEKQSLFRNNDIDGDFFRTAALIVCEKEIFEELSKLSEPLLKIIGAEEIVFSAVKEPKKAVARLFYEGDRRRRSLAEVKPTLYKAISAFLKG